MPEGRSWVVTGPDGRNWEVRTAREGEVYFRPLDRERRPKGSWRPGLPPIDDPSVLPQSLRDVLDVFIAARAEKKDEPC